MSWRVAYILALARLLGEVSKDRLAREVGGEAVTEALAHNTAPGYPLREAWRFTGEMPFVVIIYAA